MDKKEAIADFLKSFELSLKQSSIYFKEHPAFIKSVEDVKQKVDMLLHYLSPIKISFIPHSLIIEGEHWEKERIHKELAKTFHRRLIKNLVIREGTTVEELMAFITQVNLTPKNILKQGGLSSIIRRENISHISVEALDYSQLLRGEGEEIKDVWEYLLNEAMESQDAQKIVDITENFDRVVTHFKTEDFIENQDLMENINKLFIYLKEREEDKFRKCAKVLMKSILRNKDISKESKLDTLRNFFKDMSEDDFASTLWEELSTDKDFDSLSFNIFVRLTEKDKQQGIANSFAGLVKKEGLEGITPQIGEKTKDLLSSATSQIVPDIYRKTLSSLFKEISFREEKSIDRDLLQKNYQLALLELLDRERRQEQIFSILEKISGGWERIARKKDLEFVKNLVMTLKSKNVPLSSHPAWMKLNENISHLVETEILKGDTSRIFAPVIENLETSSYGAKVYLTKIFKEKIVNPYILQSFFILFPDEMYIFTKNLKRRRFDHKFLKRMTESLQSVDSHLSIFCLELIFSLGNNMLKLYVLKAMHQLPKYDEDFLLGILKKRKTALKRAALKILSRSKNSKEKAVEALVSTRSLFGIKNKILLENIRLVEEMDMKEAGSHLLSLSKKKFFWHKKIRSESLEVLRKWNERKD